MAGGDGRNFSGRDITLNIQTVLPIPALIGIPIRALRNIRLAGGRAAHDKVYPSGTP